MGGFSEARKGFQARGEQRHAAKSQLHVFEILSQIRRDTVSHEINFLCWKFCNYVDISIVVLQTCKV